MDLSRRAFMAGLATTTAGLDVLSRAGASPWSGDAHARGRQRKVVVTATAEHAGEYLYLPFHVPAGVTRMDVALTKDRGDAELGLGLFDQRGAGYGSPGFRGIYGAERSEFFLSARAASDSFLPGRIERGTWTVIVPVFRTAAPTTVSVEIVLSFGPPGPERRFGAEPGTVRGSPGWYRGDLHCHTPQSSDAWASGSALTPREWAEVAGSVGLDFVSLTDHNVITQNSTLAQDSAGTGVLLLGGQEMTNWFHGHATVTGLEPGAYLDWRQRPAGIPLGSREARIQRFIEEARELGVYTSAAHPLAAHLSWQFFADAVADPSVLPDGLEVWNGPFQPDDEAALKKWDDLLRRGRRVWANGGSDTHGTKGSAGPGHPTTVVHAEELSKAAILRALRSGRAFITRAPDGPGVYLTATGPRGQRRMVGGSVHGAATQTVVIHALVRGGAGDVLILFRDGAPVWASPITSDEQNVRLEQRIGAGGYVRAELRGEPVLDPADPLSGRQGMHALTNPIFLVAASDGGDEARG